MYDYQSVPCYLCVVPAVLKVHSIINLIYLLKNSHSQCLHESSVISYLKMKVVMGQRSTWTKLFANLWLLWFAGKSGGSNIEQWGSATLSGKLMYPATCVSTADFTFSDFNFFHTHSFLFSEVRWLPECNLFSLYESKLIKTNLHHTVHIIIKMYGCFKLLLNLHVQRAALNKWNT